MFPSRPCWPPSKPEAVATRSATRKPSRTPLPGCPTRHGAHLGLGLLYGLDGRLEVVGWLALARPPLELPAGRPAAASPGQLAGAAAGAPAAAGARPAAPAAARAPADAAGRAGAAAARAAVAAAAGVAEQRDGRAADEARHAAEPADQALERRQAVLRLVLPAATGRVKGRSGVQATAHEGLPANGHHAAGGAPLRGALVLPLRWPSAAPLELRVGPLRHVGHQDGVVLRVDRHLGALVRVGPGRRRA
jgi:hypothetical protein